MTITLSCGHESLNFPDDKVDVEMQDEYIDHDAGRFMPCIVYGDYCKACADEGVKNGYLKISQWDKDGNLIDQWKNL